MKEHISQGNEGKKFFADPNNIEYIHFSPVRTNADVGRPARRSTRKIDGGKNIFYAPATDLEEREKYLEKNKSMCEAINNGTKFNLLIDVDESGMVSIDQSYYALVKLENGEKMPFPILEAATGQKLEDQSFMAQVESSITEDDGCTVEEFEAWLKSVYGEQFQGLEMKA
jgi:hypothetical protein